MSLFNKMIMAFVETFKNNFLPVGEFVWLTLRKFD